MAGDYPSGDEALFNLCGEDVTNTFISEDLPGTFYAKLSEHRQGNLQS